MKIPAVFLNIEGIQKYADIEKEPLTFKEVLDWMDSHNMHKCHKAVESEAVTTFEIFYMCYRTIRLQIATTNLFVNLSDF